jgi:hypothetical protein
VSGAVSVDRSVGLELLRATGLMLDRAGLQAPDVYLELFERPLVAATEVFFRAESRAVLARLGGGTGIGTDGGSGSGARSNAATGSTGEASGADLAAYMRYVDFRLREEQTRAQSICLAGTEPRLLRAAHNELITRHCVDLLEGARGLVSLLDGECMADLTRLHRLYGTVRETMAFRPKAPVAALASTGALASATSGPLVYATPLVILRDSMKAYLLSRVQDAVMDRDLRRRPVDLIQALMDYREKGTRLIENGFGNDPSFQQQLKVAFEVVFSGDTVRASTAHSAADSASASASAAASAATAAAPKAGAASAAGAPPPASGPDSSPTAATLREASASASAAGAGAGAEDCSMADSTTKAGADAPRADALASRSDRGAVVPTTVMLPEGSRCQNIVAEFLSLYVDYYMKEGFRTESESGMDERLSKVVAMFRLLNTDKDVFQVFYQRDLQRRLLSNRSLSEDSERLMIAKLKAECGVASTNRFDVMMNDKRNSEEMALEYRRVRQPLSADACEIDVTVLTAALWNETAQPLALLPAPAVLSMDNFREFYLNKFQGRTLRWHMAKGSADVRGIFGVGGQGPARMYDLVVSTYQMCILCLFNDATLSDVEGGAVPFHIMEHVLNIPAEDLRRHLLSLVANKNFRILNRTGKGKDIDPNEKFSINEEFTSRLTRVRVPLIAMRSLGGGADAGGHSAVELAEVSAEVEAQRSHAMEAVLVRILKARKTIDHNTLVTEASRELAPRFLPKVRDLKKRIDSLLDRDYLERDKDNNNVYHYVN